MKKLKVIKVKEFWEFWSFGNNPEISGIYNLIFQSLPDDIDEISIEAAGVPITQQYPFASFFFSLVSLTSVKQQLTTIFCFNRF